MTVLGLPVWHSETDITPQSLNSEDGWRLKSELSEKLCFEFSHKEGEGVFLLHLDKQVGKANGIMNCKSLTDNLHVRNRQKSWE